MGRASCVLPSIKSGNTDNIVYIICYVTLPSVKFMHCTLIHSELSYYGEIYELNTEL